MLGQVHCQVDTVLSVSVFFMFHPMLELWDADFSFVKCCKLLYRVPFEFALFLVLPSYAWSYICVEILPTSPALRMLILSIT